MTDDILTSRFEGFTGAVTDTRAFYTQRHQNWTTVQAESASKFRLNYTCAGLIKAAVQRQQAYLQGVEEGKAVQVAGLCLTPDEVQARTSPFGVYCPVRYDASLITSTPIVRVSLY